MVKESRIQALLMLIKEGEITIDNIKNEEYKAEVKKRLGI